MNTSVVASFAVMVALTVSASHGGHFFVFGSGLAHGGQDVTLNESEPHAHIEPCVELAFLLSGAQLKDVVQLRSMHSPVVASCRPKQ